MKTSLPATSGRLLLYKAVTAVILLAVSSPSFALVWHHADGPGVGDTYYSSLAVAPDKSLWLANGTTLSKWTGSGWQSETIANLSGPMSWQPALTFSSDNRPHLVLTNPYGTDILYATKNAQGGWLTEYITRTAPEACQQSSIVLGPDGTPYVPIVTGVINSSEVLNLAHRDSNGVWTTSVVDSAYRAAFWPSIGMDKGGNFRIAYTTGATDDLRVATGRPGSWSFQTLDSNGMTGYLPQLLIAPNGLNRIGYLNQSLHKFGVAIQQPDGAYTLNLSDLAPYSTDSYTLALDGNGAPILCYPKEDTGEGLLLSSKWYQSTKTTAFWVGDPPGDSALATGVEWSLTSQVIDGTYYVSTGNELWWTDVPEPSSLIALCLLGLPVAGWARAMRRRK